MLQLNWALSPQNFNLLPNSGPLHIHVLFPRMPFLELFKWLAPFHIPGLILKVTNLSKVKKISHKSLYSIMAPRFLPELIVCTIVFICLFSVSLPTHRGLKAFTIVSLVPTTVLRSQRIFNKYSMDECVDNDSTFS